MVDDGESYDEELSEFEVLDADLHQLLTKRRRKADRVPRITRKRWDSDYLWDLSLREGSFLSEYRLDSRSFQLLHDMLEPALNGDTEMARRANSGCLSAPISSQSRLGVALIMLGGGRKTEAMRTHGVAESTVYDILHKVVHAINTNPALAITDNHSTIQLEQRAEGFCKRSTHSLFKFCTGCIDGLAIQIAAPRGQANQARYWSNSKKKYAINMQGVCDADCRFIAFSAKHPGGTNDAPAFSNSKLIDICMSQIFPFHWNGDNAYSLSETCMIPFPGVNLHITHPEQEAFNFWHSQLRITIERAFGIFIRRWGIFWKALQFDVAFCIQIIHACIRLHNFCINARLGIVADKYKQPPHVMVNEDGVLVEGVWPWREVEHEEWQSNKPNTGSTLRDYLVQEIKDNQYFHVRSHNLS